MGDIRSGILKNNGTSTPKAFQIHLQDCVFDTQTTMTTTFTGNASSTDGGNYYTIYNTDTGRINNVAWPLVTLREPLIKAARVSNRKS